MNFLTYVRRTGEESSFQGCHMHDLLSLLFLNVLLMFIAVG